MNLLQMKEEEEEVAVEVGLNEALQVIFKRLTSRLFSTFENEEIILPKRYKIVFEITNVLYKTRPFSK